MRLSIIRRQTVPVSQRAHKDCIDFSRNRWYPNPAIYGLSVVGFQEQGRCYLLAADGLLASTIYNSY
jgi:hypothetical protein